MLYKFSTISALIFIVIWFISIVCYKFKILPSDLHQLMSDGGIVFSFVFLLLGLILAGTGICYYITYKKTAILYNELKIDVIDKNENTIIWYYSDIDILNKMKNINKKYIKNLLLMGMLSLIYFVTVPNDIKFTFESMRGMALYFIISYFIYFIIKSDRKRSILKSPKEVVFSNKLLIFENQSILLNNVFSRLIKVVYDGVNNNLVFYFSYPSTTGRQTQKVEIYVPADKKSEINKILDMYNK